MANNNISQEMLARCQELSANCMPQLETRRFFGYFIGACEAEFASKRNEGETYNRPAVRLMKLNEPKDFAVVVSPFVRDEVQGAAITVGDRVTITQVKVGERKVDDKVYPDYRYKVVNDTTGEVIVDVKLS